MRSVPLFLAAVALLGLAPFAQAGTVFNNITQTTAGAWVVEGANVSYGEQNIAAEFTTSGAVVLSGTSVFIYGYGSNTSFEETLYNNIDGQPGLYLATIKDDLTGGGGYQLVETAGLSIDLTADTNYWLVLTPFAANSRLGWVFGGDIGTNVVWDDEYGGLSGWHPATSDNSNQFAIYDTAAVTPEPSSLALLGTGILGLAGIVRRRLA